MYEGLRHAAYNRVTIRRDCALVALPVARFRRISFPFYGSHSHRTSQKTRTREEKRRGGFGRDTHTPRKHRRSCIVQTWTQSTYFDRVVDRDARLTTATRRIPAIGLDSRAAHPARTRYAVGTYVESRLTTHDSLTSLGSGIPSSGDIHDHALNADNQHKSLRNIL